MRIVHSRVAPVLFALFFPLAGAAAGDVRIVEPGTLTPDRYEIMGRPWADAWRSAYQVPGHADRGAAIAELKLEAGRRGANALTNISCFVDESPLGSGGPHFCHALAIRIKSLESGKQKTGKQ